MILYNIPHKPWELVGVEIFSINNNTLLCIVDYYNFCIVKKADGLLAYDLIRAPKIVFKEFGPLHKIVSDTGMKNFCRQLNID